MTRVGVLVFPGSCDDRDALRAVELIGAEAVRVWHGDDRPERRRRRDRPGRVLVRRPPPLRGAGRALAGDGGGPRARRRRRSGARRLQRVPGAHRGRAPARRPSRRTPACGSAATTRRSVAERESPWLPGAAAGDRLTIPIKHHDGALVRPARAGRRARAARPGAAALRRRTPTAPSARSPCVTNERGNVAGLMPHPEHAVDELLGSTDGRVLLQGLLDLARTPVAA